MTKRAWSFGSIVYKGNWSHGVEMLKRGAFSRVDNDPPAWFQDLRIFYTVPHLRDPHPALKVADITDSIERANYTFPRAVPLKSKNVMICQFDFTADGHDHNYPDYALNPLPGEGEPTPFKVLNADAKAAGYRTLLHMNAKEVARFKTDQRDTDRILGDHPAYLAYKDYIITEWNYDAQEPFRMGWMVRGELRPNSMHGVSLGNEAFRETLQKRMFEVMGTVGADAIFLDTSKGAWNAADINPNNKPGTRANWEGLRALISGLRAAGKAVAGEMPCWETIKAGQQICEGFACGDTGFENYYKYMFAVSGCLLRDSALLFGNLATPSAEADPVSSFRQYITTIVQGAVAVVCWPPQAEAQKREERCAGRGKIWANERALYGLNHDVKYYTGASELWSTDGVLYIEVVDGAPAARTEEWLVKMLVADWYWIYGGRAPTASEFEASVANKHIVDGSLIAEVQAIAAKFEKEPTPPEKIEPRGLALTKICRLFPEYPLVGGTVRWADASGEHTAQISP